MDYSFMIDRERVLFENDRPWAAAGLDSLYPLLFTEGGTYLLDRMKKTGSCHWLRNHFTLSRHACDGFDDAGGDVYSEDENGRPIYHFEKINRILARYLEYGMKPILEMDYLPDELAPMGSAGREAGRHQNRSCPTDWDKWYDLLVAFTVNLVETFGLDEVRTWYFEVWNEADDWAYPDWQNFYRLYDVFVAAVTSVDDRLRVGGPGSYKQDFLRGFLEHVAHGTNSVTGKKGTRIDFISHHIYGMSGGWINSFPLVMPTVQSFVSQLMWVRRVVEQCGLQNVEFLLDEWGVFSHYEKNATTHPPMNLRNTEFSALFAVKLVDFLTKIREKIGFHVAKMLYWGFSAEDSEGSDSHRPFNGNRSLSTAHHLMKPIGTAHELLAKLGDELLAVTGTVSGQAVGCLAARSEKSLQLLAYHFDENDPDGQNPPKTGEISIAGLLPGSYRVATTVLDSTHHNTYNAWLAAGRPEELQDPVFDAIRACQELTEDEIATVTVGDDGCLQMPLTLPSLSAKLLVVTPV